MRQIRLSRVSFLAIFCKLTEIKQTFGFYVVYTKTIFYLSVGEGDGFRRAFSNLIVLCLCGIFLSLKRIFHLI